MNGQRNILIIILILLTGLFSSCKGQNQNKLETELKSVEDTMDYIKDHSEEKWKEVLTPMQFYVLREKGTESPYTGEYDKFYEKGTYHCAGCNSPLFESDAKFNSGCGWPAFFAPLLEDNINIQIDRTHGMVRSEVLCAHCGGHLGHVFEDGPEPTGLRYCINSVSLKFVLDSKNPKSQIPKSK